jgi:predicted nucleic acid-binding protein
MRRVLFDTSVYISVLRTTEDGVQRLRDFSAGASLWLSSVVLKELYSGATARHRRAVERLEHDFDRAHRILIPNLSDWTEAGKVLARLGARYGYEQIGKARLTNDALLAMSVARTGISLITFNQRDFARLAQFRPFSWRQASLPV